MSKKKKVDKNNPLGLKKPQPEDNPHNLNIRQFYCLEYYIQTKNKAKAAKLAGYGGENSTDNALAVQGNRTLSNVKVRAALKDRYADLVTDSKTALYNLSQLGLIVDVAKYITIRDIHERGKDGEMYLTGIIVGFDKDQFEKDGFGHLIRGFSNTQYGPRFEFRDPKDPNVWLGKAGGEFIDVVEDKRDRKIEVTFKKK